MTRMAKGALVAAGALALGGVGVLHFGFATPEQAAVNQTGRTELGADRLDAPPAPFDGKRAMGYLEAICKIGPRISGSAGMKEQQKLLHKHFADLGGKVSFQRFTVRQLSRREPVDMANLVVSWHPERSRRVILCSHYDTRPIADEESDRRRWHEPFVSANDGGSGVAFLMEFAHHMREQKTNLGVDFVFFDGEEYIYNPQTDEYFFGSLHFGAHYRRNAQPRYRSAILLDMIAGKNPRFFIERNSWFHAAPLVREIWDIAAQLKCPAFIDEQKHEVRDDHVPLNRAGIPAIDIIDFDYPHWHKLSDVPASCSSEGMEQVAQVLSIWLQRVK